jgi:hypothetical protein
LPEKVSDAHPKDEVKTVTAFDKWFYRLFEKIYFLEIQTVLVST